MPAKLLISDANVIIDMEVGGLIKQMFRLDYEFAVPDVLYETELKENHANLPKLGLKRLELQPEEVADTVELGARYRKPGRIDLMALALARQEQSQLCSSAIKQWLHVSMQYLTLRLVRVTTIGIYTLGDFVKDGRFLSGSSLLPRCIATCTWKVEAWDSWQRA